MKLFAPGKLLITGEYAVLDGAKSLALPTQRGQSMTILNHHFYDELQWQAIDFQGNEWLNVCFKIEDLSIVSSTNPKAAETLKNILTEAFFLGNGAHYLKGKKIITQLDFPNDWGLGSSSTLLCLLSKYLEIDAYQLLEKTFGGSGYDIAVGLVQKALTYQLAQYSKKNIQTIDFQPLFKENLFFIHLNQKQNSREGIQLYREKKKDRGLIEKISEITDFLLQPITVDEANALFEAHENLLSRHLELPKVKNLYFEDYPHAIKSLGAWGGDFVLAIGEEKMAKNYFPKKGFSTILTYEEMIFSPFLDAP